MLLLIALVGFSLLALQGGLELGSEPGKMTAEDIGVVTIAVSLLTQMVKWMGLPDKRGPIAVVILAAVGVGLFGWSQSTLARVTAFSYFAGWVMVSVSSAGVFGFTRAAPEAVAGTKSPPAPPGAGANTTT